MHSGAPFHTLLIRQPALRKLRLSATRRFRRKLDSRFATCSLTREGYCKSRFWAIDGCAFCDRSDLGRIISSPTNTLFIFHFSFFHHSLFIFTFVGEAISLPRIRINIVLSAIDQTKIFMSLFTIKKETRGSLLSTGFYIAIELNKRSGMSLWLTISQTPLGNIGTSHVQTLDQPPQEVLLIFTSARPADDEADLKIGKNKEYWARATRSCSRRLCF